ncbi:hypothetical protein KAU32_07345 [bacterium]|nr:hypothetical protein [bacterium]
MKKVLKRRNPCCFFLICILVTGGIYLGLNPDTFIQKYVCAMSYEAHQFHNFYNLVKAQEKETEKAFSNDELEFLLKVLLTKQKPEYISRSAVMKDGVLNVTLEINTIYHHSKICSEYNFNSEE